jgi:hypothetical protein
MADEITDLLEEVSGFEIPSHLQKFLHPERPPSESERSLSFFSYSYELAFLQLAARIKGRWRHNDLLKAPLFYLGRHSIELHLKYAIEQFAEYTGEGGRDNGHDLLALWGELRRQFELASIPNAGDDWGRHVDRLIKHIHAIDPKGESFRYPHNLSGKLFNYTRVELEGLVKAHQHITGYCGASIDVLSTRNEYWRS